MSPHLTVVTLGVSDLARAERFYVALGFARSSTSNENIAFFDGGAVVIGLYPRQLLAEDACLPSEGAGFGGITLAINVARPADVDATLMRAEEAGAKILKSARKVFWGGYSGYFADPDGHPWEVAHNPHWELGEGGLVRLPA